MCNIYRFCKAQWPNQRISLALYKYMSLLYQFATGCSNLRKSLSFIICCCPAERFNINQIFSTPTNCTYTIKYMYYLSSFSYFISAVIAPSSLRNLFISAHLYKKILPEDGAIITEICRRKNDNQYMHFFVYVHFVGVLKT